MMGISSHMQTLSQYLKTEKIRQTEFAEMIGTTQGTVSRLCSGTQNPTLDLAQRVEKATGGQVPIVAWPNIAKLAEALSGPAQQAAS